MATANISTLNGSQLAVNQGYGGAFNFGPIKDNTNTAVDFSTWYSLACELVPGSASPVSSARAAGTVTGDNLGNLKLVLANADTSSNGLGTCSYVIKGQPTSGDPPQALVRGSFAVLQSV